MQYGLGTYLHELTESLLKITDITIYLVAYNVSNSKEFLINKTSSRYIEVIVPSPSNKFPQTINSDIKYASAVVKLLSNYIPQQDRVIFQMNHTDDFPIMRALKKYYNYPIIVVVQFAAWQQLFEGNRRKFTGFNLDKPSNNIDFLFSNEREFYRLSDHIVSVTNYMRDFLIEEYGIPEGKISVIRNGFNQKKHRRGFANKKYALRKKLGFRDDDFILLFSGRIDSSKGIFYLIEAFEEVCKTHENLRLILIGEGEIQKCFQLTRAFYGKITYTGFLQKDLVASFYKIADVGIVPSLYDHCPLTILEMMSNKIPLIVSKTNGIDEMLNDHECIFIDPIVTKNGDISFNIKELSDAIITLSKNNDVRKKLSKKSFETFKKRFEASGMASEMDCLFSTLAIDL